MKYFEVNDRLDECVAIKKGQASILVQWHLSSTTKEIIKESFGVHVTGKNIVIVIYDTTGIAFNGHNAHRLKQYRNIKGRNCCFIQHLPVNQTYTLDVAIYTKSGQLFSLIRSNEIYLDGPANANRKYDSAWKHIHKRSPKWQETFSAYSCYTIDMNMKEQKRVGRLTLNQINQSKRYV
ncbi:DUF4912 domain-containing protein [Metabacillus iocasae]|uniref:Uncharacterized protein n=1 Tax=Priestia iocasae TaxID=2291674 RepID=A0ABS2QQ12_9BACI|nr:hypothetical protein [Metabacillus iocasae]